MDRSRRPPSFSRTYSRTQDLQVGLRGLSFGTYCAPLCAPQFQDVQVFPSVRYSGSIPRFSFVSRTRRKCSPPQTSKPNPSANLHLRIGFDVQISLQFLPKYPTIAPLPPVPNCQYQSAWIRSSSALPKSPRRRFPPTYGIGWNQGFNL